MSPIALVMNLSFLTCSSIVAVHGIAAHPKRTWTKNGVNWLTDSNMLPSVLPHARIFRFGYESEWLGSKAIQVKISTIANQLLQALKSLYSVSALLLFRQHAAEVCA